MLAGKVIIGTAGKQKTNKNTGHKESNVYTAHCFQSPG
jgi:hypothetical protein